MKEQCIACEQLGSATFWKVGPHAVLCRDHLVELANVVEAAPAFQEWTMAGLAYTEYLAALKGGGSPDPAPALRLVEAGEGASTVARQQLDKWFSDKMEWLAKRRADREARKETTDGRPD